VESKVANSRFIEEAVRWRVFHRTVQDIRARNADTDPDEIRTSQATRADCWSSTATKARR
jgi:hypothetical protein